MKRKITPNLGFFEKKMPLERFIPAVFLIFLLFFVALSIITYKYINTYKQNLTWVTHQQEVLRRTSTINGYLIKMPLARRGFVITGDTTYLSDFNRLQITVKNEIKEFKAIQLENGNELDIANKLESRSNELLDLLSQSIEKYQKEGKINTSQIEITNDVEKKLGEIDEIIKEIVNAEKEQLLIRNADLENSSYNVQVFIIITSLFAFIVIGLSLYISIRLIQYKRKTENLLKQSYDELENKVDDRTAELKAANETLKQEINNRINIENSLRESEERFRVLADSSPVLIWMSGEDKLCTYFNNVWLEFTGRSLEQELGNGWTDGIHPEDLQRCLDAYILAFDKRENFEIEFRLKNSYGEYTWVLNKGIPRYEGNKFVGYIGGCINIHERKKNERYLKIQHAVSKTLAEANTIEETCIRVLENICSGVNWEFGILWMVDENKNKLFPESTWSANSLKAREFVRVYDKYVEKGKDLPGLVWATGRSMWLMDIIYDKNFERKEIASKLGWNSAFAIPITNGYEIIAVVECLNQDILTPKADLLEVLESIGRQIGNYLERKKAENKLKQSYAELENRVKDRTVELATTLNKLLAEIEYKEKIQGRLKLFAHAIRGIKECVYITDLENNTLFVNAAFESIYGYQEDELKDKEIPVLFSDIISKEARTKILSSTLKTGWSGELKNKRKDGSEFFIHLSTSVIRNEDGKIQAIVGICQDISELKAAEQLIIKRNSLLKLLNDIIIITNKSFDLKSSITYAINKVCQYTLWDLGHCYLLDGNVLKSTRIWNYDADSKYNVYQQESEKIEFEKGSGLPGKTLESSKSVWLSLKDMNKKTFRRIEVASDASLKTIICVPIMKQTRAIGVLEFFKTEEETIDKEVLECISNIGVELGSLAERIEILEQIKISERQFKAVSDTANDAIVTINQQGKIIYLNSSTEKIFGYSENELINKELSLLIPGKYIDRYKAAFKKAFASGELILQGKTFEFSGKHKSGNEFPIELSLAKWEINNETFITAMVKDITLRKEIEKELLEKQKMLEEAQQIAKLGSWEWDIKNNIFSWSDELYSIYETNRKQFNPTYEGFLGRIHPEDVEGVKAIIQKAFENKESFSYDHRILTPSGKIKILKAQGEVYTDDEGNVNRLFGTTLDITELRKTEEKVRESERQLKNAQKIAKLGSWKYSLKENIVYWSDEIYNIFEIDTSENPLFNETFLEYVVPEDKPELEVAMKKALEGKKPYAYEYRIRTKSGNMKYLKTQGEIHLDIDNEIDYIVGTVIDITDIKKAEIKIRESEKQLKQAQKIARLGSWEWSLKNDKIKWSDEIYEIFQVEPGSEIKVKQFDSMISEEDKAVRDKLIDEAIKFGKPFNFFFRIKLNNGKTKILNSQAEAYKDKLGNVNRLIGTIMDVTDIKQAEEKIKKNERQLKEAQKIAKLGSWEIDLQSGESICSDELYRIYEVAPNNPPPIYNNIRSIIHPDDLTMVDEMVSMLSNSPKPVQFDYRIITDTGKLKYLTCDILVEFNDSKPVRHYGSVQDITDIKLVEEKLRKTNEKLLEAQKELIHNEKLAALGRFSSGIAHEIRNPLANISALSQLLSKADLDEKSRKHLKYILVNADIANKIIKDLLNFASPEDLSFRKEKIDEFLENVLESVEPRCLENNVNIIRCISNDLPKINIDKLKLENAFMNFISNALDAMPRGGELKVEVQKDKFQKELIITISDTGVGIAPENLDKILEPFYTTKEYGTGLGLGMAYQTIKLHQGTVKIDSSLGNGTTVEIKLPFSRN